MESEFENLFRNRLRLHFIQLLKSVSSESLPSLIQLAKYILVEKEDEGDSNHLITDFKAKFLSEYSHDLVKHEFKEYIYTSFFSQVLSHIQVDSSLKQQLSEVLFVSCFNQTFNLLYDLCCSSSSASPFHVYLMKQFLSRHCIRDMLMDEQSATNRSNLVQRITNLPDKLCNYSLAHKLFSPLSYFKLVAVDLIMCLKSIQHDKKRRDCVIELVALVFGKITFLGYRELMGNYFLKQLIPLCYQSPEWQLVGQKLFSSIEYKYADSCLINLIRFSSSFKDLSVTLGDSISTNSNIKYILTEKFIFLKILNQDTHIQVLLGYIYDSSRSSYYSIFKNLLNTWSKQASIANTSHEQHLYLTKCILVCVSLMQGQQDKSELAVEMNSLLKGVEQHLHSPIDSIREYGMLIGEYLMNILHDQDVKPLKFQFECTEEIESLKKLADKRPVSDSIYEKARESGQEDLVINLSSVEKIIVKDEKSKINIVQVENDSDDDDDDLKPYDLSNEVPKLKQGQPVYLRDCMELLIYSEEPDKIQAALESVEKLCNTYHYELEEICVELVKILLHKSNQYAIEGFEEKRVSAMTCIVQHYPKECGQYMTSQFYEAGYTLTQRVDILCVLTTAAQYLSNPNQEPLFDKRMFYYKQRSAELDLLAFNKSMNKENWRDVVQKRIDAKTKLKTSVKTNKTTKSKENKNSDVFGYFFFPLLNSYDKTLVHMSIVGQDFMLLGKMIFSLSVILYSSINTTVLENMVNAFIDFLWALRNHPEPFVRSSILFAYMITLMVVPDSLFMIKMTNYFMELNYWLENVVINDANVECKKRAAECLSLISKRVASLNYK